MSQTLTRRSLVKAAPFTAVAASIPLIAAAAGATPGPDSELLQLATDFERLHREWQDLDTAAGRLEPPISANFDNTTDTMEEFWRCRKESGYEDAVAVAGSKLDELDVVANRMRELPTQTLRGLAAKARLVQFDALLSLDAGMQRPEIDWDWNVLCMERFVREIERFAATHSTGGLNA